MNHEEQIRNHSGDMLEKLVTELISKEAVEVRFEFEDNEQWSVATIHIGEEDGVYKEDEEISLRLHANDIFNLYFGYYDDKDEFHELIQPLTSEEKKIIPKGLQKVMTKVLSDEQGMRLPGHLISK